MSTWLAGRVKRLSEFIIKLRVAIRVARTRVCNSERIRIYVAYADVLRVLVDKPFSIVCNATDITFRNFDRSSFSETTKFGVDKQSLCTQTPSAQASPRENA